MVGGYGNFLVEIYVIGRGICEKKPGQYYTFASKLIVSRNHTNEMKSNEITYIFVP